MIARLKQAWRSDLRLRVFAGIVFAVVLGSSLNAGYDLWRLHADADARLEDRLRRQSQLVGEALARPLFDFNSAAVTSVVSALGASPDVAGVRVFDPSGTLLAEAGDPARKSRGNAGMRRDISFEDGGHVTPVGSLELVLSSDTLDAEVARRVVVDVLSNLLMALAIILVLWVLMARLGRSFDDLQTSLEKLARGDTDIQLSGLDSEDQIGRVSRAVLRFRDTIRLLHEAERAREDLLQEKNAMLDNAVVGITTVRRRMLLSCNPKFESMFGYGPGEMLGLATRTLYADKQHFEMVTQGFDALDPGSHFSAEVRMRRRDGSCFWAVVAGHGHGAGSSDSTWICSDISERKEAEEALAGHQQMLEETVAERTRQLAVAKEEAEHASRSKSEFLANMSHEIRTPLNAVLGLAHLTLQTTLQPRQQDWLQKIQSAGSTLLAVINDILDFSKIEAGKLEIECIAFDLWDVLENVGVVCGNQAAENNLDFMLDVQDGCPAAYLGDPTRLGQVLINLCGNAVKFTTAGEVRVRVELADGANAEGVSLRFAVTDTGIGISAAKIEQLFRPFSQADNSTTRRFGGTGLGLSISRRLVELMGGSIGVQSQPGRGSTFYFTLPLQLDPAAQPVPPPRDLYGKRAMLVLAGESKRACVAAQLGGLGVCVETEETARVSADFVVVDDTMQGLLDLDLPQLCLTTVQAPQADAAGMRASVSEPTTPRALTRALRVLFRSAAAPGPLAQADQVPRVDGARVLIAEDVALNREILRELLAATGAQVDEAENGVRAVERVLAHAPGHYALVLMDIQMPEMDGFTAAARILQDARHAGQPIVALTAHAFHDDREHSLAVGMKDHVAKPVDPAGLYAVVRRWCSAPGAAGEPAVVSMPAPPALPAPPAPADDDELPELRGIDTADMLQRMRGRGATCRRILLSFRGTFAGYDRRLEEALEQENYSTGAELAHTLKGVAGNISAPQLHRHAAELERQFRAGNRSRAGAELAELRQELDRVLGGLAELET
ncbi:MAG: response regulator [Rhodocyclaceae bacterium]|nr:response regulator [Rhodocyclaceae bacterium]MBX3669354.1 response regulator [Rhodocyclaceae bacterium]